MTDDAPPSNSPVARADRNARRELRVSRRGGIPAARFPTPPNMDRMSDDEIGQWYADRLPDEEVEKLNAVSEALEEQGCADEYEIRVLMNAFHVHPEEPVDVEKLSGVLGIDVDDVLEQLEGGG